MEDNPREILTAAGVECPELEEYEEGFERAIYGDPTPVILALARLVAELNARRNVLKVKVDGGYLTNVEAIELEVVEGGRVGSLDFRLGEYYVVCHA